MNGKTLIYAVVGILVAALAAIVLIVVRDPVDANDLVVVGLVLAFVTSSIASLYAAVKAAAAVTAAKETTEHVQNLSIQVDGRLTKLLATTERAARAEGNVEGARRAEDGARDRAVATAAAVAAEAATTAAAVDVVREIGARNEDHRI